jgi:serine/threonine protein kinase
MTDNRPGPLPGKRIVPPTKSTAVAEERVVEFLRKRDYVLLKELGAGACGKTVLLRDDDLNQHFVCKKYAPVEESLRQSLFDAFVSEIKLLHKLQHANIVRVFNWYLYPETLTGYILLEYVEGSHIDDFIRSHPELINEVFVQVVTGFAYLEQNKILHRDVRPANVMVGARGVVKIIDLGFGKQIRQTLDFKKSISLNWWCDPPEEFNSARYDFRTEIYFVGKLFDRLVQECDLQQFKYKEVLGLMCQWKASDRLPSFVDALKNIENDRFYEINFLPPELAAYREFADHLASHITKIARDAKYPDDAARIKEDLEAVYHNVMLAEVVPDCAAITRAVIKGNYYYKKEGFQVQILRNFVWLLKTVSIEKQRVILANLWTQLDAVKRYEPPAEFDDDIPF